MTKKELILVIVTLIVGIGGSAAFMVLTKDKTPSKSNTSSSEHSEGHDSTSGGNSKSDGTKAPQVDLTSQTSVAIDIKDFAYSKPNIKVKKGTTVTWTNQDAIQHNAMKAHDNSGTAHDAPTADEVNPDEFAGPLLKKGESYSFTFNEAGSDPYHCAPHPYMKGIVTVVE